jgi:Caspase domain/Sel1 repeat
MRNILSPAWRPILALTVLIMTLALIGAAPAAGTSRTEHNVALIIGNGAYTSVNELPNPANDAAAIADSLQRIGFDVTLLLNLPNNGMRKALEDFEDKVGGASIAIVYYAGHGMEIDGINYLIPVDAKLRRDTHVVDEAVSLDRVLTAVSGASKLSLVLLDACRDNPFVARMQRSVANRSVSRGLTSVEPTGSTLVSFAAEAGTVADDGVGGHSPYATGLLRYLSTPGLEINFVFRRVDAYVRDFTNGRQKPVYYGSLGTDEVYLVPPTNTSAVAATVAAPAVERNQETIEQVTLEEVYWRTIRDSEIIEDFRTYLSRYPSGAFVDLGNARILALDRAATVNKLAKPGPSGKPEEAALRRAALAQIDRIPKNFIQFGLIALDFPIKEISGILDAPTRAAIRGYQSSVGQKQTGELTPQQTVNLLLAAASTGNSHAETAVGFMTASGIGLNRDYLLARGWLTKAAQQDDPYAQINLAMLFRDGLGVGRDLGRARQLLKQASDRGIEEAQTDLDRLEQK